MGLMLLVQPCVFLQQRAKKKKKRRMKGWRVVAGHSRNVLVDLKIPQASEQEVHTLKRRVTVNGDLSDIGTRDVMTHDA